MIDSATNYERQTLWDVLLWPERAQEVCDMLPAGMFTQTDWRNVRLAVGDLLENSLPVNVATVSEVLAERNHLTEILRDELDILSRDQSSGAELTYHAGKVLENHQKRQARQILERRTAQLANGCAYSEVMDALTADLSSLAIMKPIQSRFAGITADQLLEYSTTEPDWLVEGIFSADQPTLFGSRSKCLKTTQLIDLAVAIVNGTRWLNHFDVPQRRRVLFITGESNLRAVSRRFVKACKAHATDLPSIGDMLRVEAVDFPKLPRMQDCRAIQQAVKNHGIEVVILDPLYRGLTSEIDTHRMSEVGDAIVHFTQCCQPASTIISHHVIKVAAREYGSPPELEDLNGAGIAESCGNWWLVGRNEKYQWDWMHDLCVQFGGRDEQAGARRIVFNEATWTAEVESFSDFIEGQQETAQQAQDEAKRNSHQRKIERARARVLSIMRNVKHPRSKNEIETLRGEVSQLPFREAFADMVQDRSVRTAPYRDGCNRLQSAGYILADYHDEYLSNFTQSEGAR